MGLSLFNLSSFCFSVRYSASSVCLHVSGVTWHLTCLSFLCQGSGIRPQWSFETPSNSSQQVHLQVPPQYRRGPSVHLWGFSRPNCPSTRSISWTQVSSVSSSIRTLKATERMCTGVQDTEALVWGWYWVSRAIMKSDQAGMSRDGLCLLLMHDLVLSL